MKELEELLPCKSPLWIQLLDCLMFLPEARTNSRTGVRVGRILLTTPGFILSCKIFSHSFVILYIYIITCTFQKWYPGFYFCSLATVTAAINVNSLCLSKIEFSVCCKKGSEAFFPLKGLSKWSGSEGEMSLLCFHSVPQTQTDFFFLFWRWQWQCWDILLVPSPNKQTIWQNLLWQCGEKN